MDKLSIVPSWAFQDFAVIVAAIVVVVSVIRKEAHPESVLLEMAAFVLLYAAVYENFATIVGLYAYGRSLLMIGNVPLAVPLVEYLVVYCTLRLLGAMKVPIWSKPFIVGYAAVLFDFALDPLAIKLVQAAQGGTIGRWTWFMNPGDVAIYGEPVFNFSGWMLICGYAAALILLGRWWHRRSGYDRRVGIAYPLLAMVVSLGLVVSPLSNFLLWLQPLAARGSAAEWIMLGTWLVLPVVLLAAAWRGRMREPFAVRENLPVFAVLVGLPLVTVITTIACGVFEVLWLEVAAAAALAGLVAAVALRGRSAVAPELPGARPA